jgi:2-haloacid dehalogenase
MNPVAPWVCVFDVNETLLDIEFIAPIFQRLFGDRKVLREWFGQLVLYSNAMTLCGPYTTFFDLGQGVLKMLGSIHSVAITEADVDELRTRMLTMPAHADVPLGLKQLKDAGFRLVTCTNSPPPTQKPTRSGTQASTAGSKVHSASIAFVASNRHRRFTTWSPRS